VSLHGTLETFALPDVLTLLTATKKSGELRVVGGRIDGRVWFDAGEVVGADVAGGTSAVDAIFELLRLPSGTFSFDADRTAPSPGAPAATDILLADAQARLSEWREIETVIPSLDHLVRLVPEVRDPSVVVSGEQWRALVGVASSTTVRALMAQLSLGEFDTCRTLKALVDAGLVAVEAPPVAAPAPAPVVVAPEPARAPAEPARAPAEVAEAEAAAPKAEAVPAAPALPEPAVVRTAEVPESVTKGRRGGRSAAEEAATSPVQAIAERLEALANARPAEGSAGPGQAPTVEPEGSADPDAEEATSPDTGEPINRGLLLKFLSSVRS